MLSRGCEAKARSVLDTVLSPLPLWFVHAVFLHLPVDTRLRCSEVSRAWRALLADTTLFASLDLSISSGLARFSEALLRAAVAKAGGQLRTLDFTGRVVDYGPDKRLLLEVVAANAATLTELRLDTDEFLFADDARTLVTVVRDLQLLEVTLFLRDREVARAILHNEPPFQALRLRKLIMACRLEATADTVAFSSDLRSHASLEMLFLYDAALNTATPMGAVVDACIALRLRNLSLSSCRIMPAVLPEVTRLIAAGALWELTVINNRLEIFETAHESTRLFVVAVRASAMTRLQFNLMAVPPESVVEAAAFINARQQ